MKVFALFCLWGYMGFKLAKQDSKAFVSFCSPLFSFCTHSLLHRLDDYGESSLHHATHGGHLEVVELLLTLGSVQVDIPNARNETALSVACRKGHGTVVQLLLKARERCKGGHLRGVLIKV